MIHHKFPALAFSKPRGLHSWRARALLGAAVAALLSVAACGGGGSEDAAQQREAAMAVPAAGPQESHVRVPLQVPMQSVDQPLTTDGILRWAQLTYPELFPDSPPIVPVQHAGALYEVRSYQNGNHLGVSDGRIFGLGPFTGNVLREFGAVVDYGPTACAVVDCGRLASGAVYEDVTVLGVGPYPLKDVLLQGQLMRSRSLESRLLGNVEVLAAVPVYVKVEDHDRLFSAPSKLTITKGQDWTYKLALTGQRLTKAGRFTGQLRAFACLDPQCTTRLDGTPISVPYDIVVLPRLVFGPERVEVTVPYGTVPKDVVIDTTAPPGVKRVTMTPKTIAQYDPLRGKVSSSLLGPKDVSSRSPRIRLAFSQAPVGRYVGQVPIEVDFEVNDWPHRLYDDRFIEVVYTVTRDGLPAVQFDVLDPNLFRMPRDTHFWVTSSFRRNRNDMSVEFVGIEYLTFPAAEKDESLRTQWIGLPPSPVNENKFTFLIQTCSPPRAVSNEPRRCLASGNYTAQARFRVRYPHPQTGASVVEEATQVINITLL